MYVRLGKYGVVLYSLKNPCRKNKIVAHRFFFSFGDFDWFLLRFTSSVPAFRRRRRQPTLHPPFLVALRKKKLYKSRKKLCGSVLFLNHVRSVTFIMPVRRTNIKTTFPFFFTFYMSTSIYGNYTEINRKWCKRKMEGKKTAKTFFFPPPSKLLCRCSQCMYREK